MHNKNLRSQATQPGKRITIQDLPAQLVELSEKDLQHINGGGCGCCYKNWFENRPLLPPLEF